MWKRIGTVCAVAMMLAACNSSAEEAVDVTDFAFVEFSGNNGEGTASHGFDQKQFMLQVFQYDDATGAADEETVKEMDTVNNAMTVTLDRQTGLANGDQVTLTVDVDESKTTKIKDATKTFTVTGLQQ